MVDLCFKNLQIFYLVFLPLKHRKAKETVELILSKFTHLPFSVPELYYQIISPFLSDYKKILVSGEFIRIYVNKILAKSKISIINNNLL